jgi:hypothetical protein
MRSFLRAWMVVVVYCALLWAPTMVEGYSVTLEPSEEQCFFVTAEQDDTCAGSFEVITPNPAPIIVTVTGPEPARTVHFESRQGEGVDAKTDKELSEGSFQFEAEEAGDYVMCISNGKEDADGVVRIVAFNFRTSQQEEGDYEYNGIDQELSEMRQGLELLRDHQSYMGQREDVHREAMDSINTKVLVWTIMEAIILIGMSFWQISYIRSFFETKRRL